MLIYKFAWIHDSRRIQVCFELTDPATGGGIGFLKPAFMIQAYSVVMADIAAALSHGPGNSLLEAMPLFDRIFFQGEEDRKVNANTIRVSVTQV